MRITPVAALLVALLAVSLGAGGQKPGTESMVKRLAAIAAVGDPLRNPILNTQRALLLHERFQKTETTEIGFALAEELLKAGASQSAIDHLLLLRDAIEGARVKDQAALLMRTRELLGIAYLRLGEQTNCLSHHTGASCIFPISGRGVHHMKDPAKTAARMFEELIAIRERPAYIWLLNLAHMSAGDYPDAVPERWRIVAPGLTASPFMTRFIDVAPERGVDMQGGAGGSIMEDFDGDGDLDLFASDWSISRQMRYFRNEGRGHFVDRTEQARLLGETGGLNLVQGDYDNDGDADVLVLRGAWLYDQGEQPLSLLANKGGTFEDVTEQAGLLRFHPTQTGTWADYDGDGWLDLFIGNESSPNKAHRCELFRNNGNGTFTEQAAAVGLAVTGFVKGAVWGDYNRDRRPDLYLSRWGQPNLLFRNDGLVNGTWKFTDVTAAAGVAEPVMSFPAWFWDFDNDGWQDLFVASFTGFASDSLDILVAEYLGRRAEGPYSRLYRNNRDGTFKDVTRAVGLDMPLAVMGANFGDFDNDGFLDMYLGTGEPSLLTLVPNRMFRNDSGRAFKDVTIEAGVGHLQKGHGVAIGDVDGDGDEDIYVVLGGAYEGDVYQNALFLNQNPRRPQVTLRLRGTRQNRLAIGAEIELVATTPRGPRSIYRVVGSGGSFGGASLQQEIGLGDATAVRYVTVRWPTSGMVEVFDRIPLDRVATLVEGRGTAAP